MKTIYLFRHAKSNWDIATSDKERDLLPIGIERTKKMADFILKSFQMEGLKEIPEKWYSSPAKRAYKTANLVTSALKTPYEIYPPLYTFSLIELEKIVRNFNNKYSVIAIFGHNTAFTDFINKYGSTKINNLPTSGMVCIEFSINSWTEISTGNTTHLLFPKNI